jgi:predicted RNase H-like HicB family nuclease
MIKEKAKTHRVYEVLARWDSEGGVWVAESRDVPGLVAEAESPNTLAQKLRVLIPELLELNGVIASGSGPVEFLVRYQHEESGVTALAS